MSPESRILVALLCALAVAAIAYVVMHWLDKRRRRIAFPEHEEPLADVLRREAEEAQRKCLAEQLGSAPQCTADGCTIAAYHSPCERRAAIAKRA